MISSLRAGAMIGLAGLASCGCTSGNSSFLSGGSSVAKSQHVSASQGVSEASPLASSPANAVSYAQLGPISSIDVLRWTSCGTRDDIIIDRIERSSSVFHLTAAEENRLRDKGVSETVIQEMKTTARR